MGKRLLFLVSFLLTIFIAPFPIFAEEPKAPSSGSEFSTSYDTTYEIGADGVAQVTQKITLTNLTSRYYVSNFTLTIGSTTVTDISASDKSGPMEIKTEKKDNKTSITVNFNQQVAGIDKQQTFTLRFKSRDFAQSIGRVWEVNLPKIPSSASLENYSLVLSVPSSFGDPTSIAPTPKSQSQTFDKQFFTFSKDQLSKNGVSINFGTSQVFDFNLKYNLENTSLFPVVTYVTLPPDTAYQDVLISRISPEPSNVTMDEDGNYLAWYKLARNSKQDVLVSGSAKLYISTKEKVNKRLQFITDQQKISLTKSDQYWEKDNQSIKATLEEILKDETGEPTGQNLATRQKVQKIYQYVVNHLKYSTDKLNSAEIERLGAVTALSNPDSSVCMEFTDLFIALTRAAGIPSRELDGFAYSQNPSLRPLSLSRDLLHAWPEYYDEQKGWIMVDPTWENTSGGVDYFNKFDLNHLVLAIKGTSSTSPYTSDDVKAVISDKDFLGKPQLDVKLEAADTIFAGFPASFTLNVVNRGNTIQYENYLKVSAQKIEILTANSLMLEPIPPFGSASYKFDLRTPFLWQEVKGVIEVDLGGEKISKEISVKPFFLFQPIPYVFAGLVGLIVLIYGSTLTLHLLKKKSLSSTAK